MRTRSTSIRILGALLALLVSCDEPEESDSPTPEPTCANAPVGEVLIVADAGAWSAEPATEAECPSSRR